MVSMYYSFNTSPIPIAASPQKCIKSKGSKCENGEYVGCSVVVEVVVVGAWRPVFGAAIVWGRCWFSPGPVFVENPIARGSEWMPHLLRQSMVQYIRELDPIDELPSETEMELRN